MNISLIANLLDEAIATAGRAEFARLAKGLTPVQLISSVKAALDGLSGLTRGVPPNYHDEWVALFYLLWHQPKQINLAYRLIENMLVERRHGEKLVLNDEKRLHVIDFGSGSLAVQFAVGLPLAKAVELGEKTPEVHIHSIDPSIAMMELGKSCWKVFNGRIAEIQECTSAAQAFCSIVPSYDIGIGTIPEKEISADYWLSAIHAVYNTNKEAVTQELEVLYNNFSPSAGFVTSHGYHERMLESISPFDLGRYAKTNGVDRSGFRGELPITTQARKDMLAIIRQHTSLNTGIVERFLSNPVTWDWPFAACRTYSRQW